MSGFLEEPDASQANEINNLTRVCRKCRVSVGEERAQEIPVAPSQPVTRPVRLVT